jgi:hypothetical protein
MVGEAFAGLSAIKTAFDIAKGLKDIDDAARRNAAIIELQKELLSAQAAQSDMTQRIRDLQEELASFETWDAEKEKYQLKQLVPSGPSFAYVLKPQAASGEPFHCICATCYQKRIKSVLQFLRTVLVGGDEMILSCPVCGTQVHTFGWPPR